MYKIFALFVSVIILFGVFFSGCLDMTKSSSGSDHQGDDSLVIAVDSDESPIRNYFTTPKILWTFDDYYVEYHHQPPHKGFGGLTERINSYGGFVQLMVVFTSEASTKPFGNELGNYSVINDFGYSPHDVAESVAFFSRPQVTAACHGWNHTMSLNNLNLSFAYDLVNYTMWNWKNNYGITPHFFLGPSTTGNYNLTLALKRFSERYWMVYGENFRWYDSKLFPNASRNDPAVEYIDKPSYVVEFDPLFGAGWGDPSKNLSEAISRFNQLSSGKEIFFIRGHPGSLNGTDPSAQENLSYWGQWIDWMYQTHELININHTQAIEYNVDRFHFQVIKVDNDNFIIDLTNCSFDHTVLFSKPVNSTKNWGLFDENENLLGDVQNETFFDLTQGSIYTFKVN
jgi:hypothetical protein